MYPQFEDKFFDRFDSIRNFLTKRINECKIKDATDNSYSHLLDTLVIRAYIYCFKFINFVHEKFHKSIDLFIFPDNRDAVIFYLLPHLITPSNVGKKNKENTTADKPKKISTAEYRDSFIIHVRVILSTIHTFIPSMASYYKAI